MLERSSLHFLKIAECGNLARAAQMLGIGPSALTRSVQGLEKKLGAVLFERTPRGMALTPIGEALCARLTGAQAALADAEAEIAHMVSGSVGRVRIGVGHIVADPVRDALFPKLLLDRPAAKVDVYVGVNVDLFERVSNGSLDFAVCGVANGVPDALESTVLMRSAMVAVVRVGHPLSHMAQPTLEMLQKYRYASASGMLPGDPLADKRVREFGGQHLDQAFTTNSMNTLLEVVARTDLVAITTWNPSVQRRWGGQLLPISIQGGVIKSVVGSVFRRGRYVSPLAQYALYLVEEALRTPAAAPWAFAHK